MITSVHVLVKKCTVLNRLKTLTLVALKRAPPSLRLENDYFSTHCSKEMHCSEQTNKTDSGHPEADPSLPRTENDYFSTRFSKERHCPEQTEKDGL